MKEALLYHKLGENQVQCDLCNHRCKIAEGKWGICGVRQNQSGALFSSVYGKVIAAHVDPVEKKPLYHFLPGSASFSIATEGCNFQCSFCQNWEISQKRPRDGQGLGGGVTDILPEEIIRSALNQHCQSIAYTYTEPTIYFEFAYDCARIARDKGIKNIFVTNGYMTKEAIDLAGPYLDAANVDLKFFDDKLYRKICGGGLEGVLDSIRLMKKNGVWVEVTTLVVPTQNDDDSQLKGIAGFIAGVDKNIPWHISRFFPNYQITEAAITPESTLKRAEEFGYNAGLKYVYIGNVYGFGNDTHCHNCRRLLIRRDGFAIIENNLKSGKCVFCKTTIPGVFE